MKKLVLFLALVVLAATSHAALVDITGEPLPVSPRGFYDRCQDNDEDLDIRKADADSVASSVNTRTGDVVLTKDDVGLLNADNTSDADKPVSTATQTELALKADVSNVLELDNTTPFTPDADHEPATMKFVLDNAAAGAVSSVNTRTGAVVLTSTDVGLENVDNTSDVNKPISTLNQTALDGKEPLKGADDNYVTDAEKVVIGDTSGTNTGDKTDPEIKTAYENNVDTNAYTDTEKTKLAGVAEGATNFDPADAGDIVAESLSVTGTDGLNGLTDVGDNTSQGAVGNLALIPINGVWNKVESGVASPIGSGGGVAIDDNAGDGDTTVTWSANKSFDELLLKADKSDTYTKTEVDDLIAAALGFPLVSIIAPTAAQWITESPYTGFNGISSDGGTVTDMEWKLEAGGTYAATTGTETWSVVSVPVTEGENTLYARATDDQANQTEVPVTFNVDSIDPVVVADADSTHDGVGTVVGGMTLTEVNPGAMTASVDGATPTTTPLTVTTGNNYVTGSLTPDGVGEITVTFDGVADLAGNIAATTDLVQVFNYSAPVATLFEWGCDTLTAEKFNATDGGTITISDGDGNGYSFTNGGMQFNLGTRGYFTATNGNNVNYALGSIEFDYQSISGTSTDAHRILMIGDSVHDITLRRGSASEFVYAVHYAETAYFVDTTENLYDGAEHAVKVAWNAAGSSVVLTIDGSEYPITLGSTDTPTVATGRVHFNGDSTAAAQMVGWYDNVVIK